MREKPIILVLFDDDIVAWQVVIEKRDAEINELRIKLENPELTDKQIRNIQLDIENIEAEKNSQQERIDGDKKTLAAIVEAINTEDTKSLELLWLNTNVAVRSAFQRNQPKLADEYNFDISQLPLMATVNVPDSALKPMRRDDSQIQQTNRFMELMATKVNSRLFNVFKKTDAMSQAFLPFVPTTELIKQSKSIDWEKLNVPDNSRAYITDVYYCAIANPTDSELNKDSLLTETPERIALLSKCASTPAFSLSIDRLGHKAKFNLIEIALYYNNVDIAEKLYNIHKQHSTDKLTFDIRILGALFNIDCNISIKKRKIDTSAAIAWLYEHADTESLQAMLKYDDCHVFRSAVMDNDLPRMELIWEKADANTRIQMLKSDNCYALLHAAHDDNIEKLEWLWKRADAATQQIMLRGNRSFAFSNAALHSRTETENWLWQHANPDTQQQMLLESRGYECDVFCLAAKMGKLDVMKSLWNKADAFTRTCMLEAGEIMGKGVCSNAAFRLAMSRNDMEMVEWLWGNADAKTQQSFICSGGFTSFHTASYDGELAKMQWIWNKADPSVRQDMLFAAGKDDYGYQPFAVSCRYGHLEAAKWLLENTDSSKRSAMLETENCAPIRKAHENNKPEMVEWLWQQSPQHTKEIIRNRALISADMLKHLDEAYPVSEAVSSTKSLNRK